MSDYINRREAAEILGVTLGRVDQLIRDGRLPSELVAGHRVFSRRVVLKFSRIPRVRTGRPKVAS